MKNDANSEDDRDQLDPVLCQRELPKEVQEARDRRAADAEAERAFYEPRIREHLEFHRGVITYLDGVQQWIADTYDFDLAGDTRPAAVWQMSGRILGSCHMIIDNLEMGYTSEVVNSGRSVHEANRLLEVFLMPKEKDLLRRWMDDQNIPAVTLRKAERRYQKEVVKLMKAQGLEANFPSTDELSGQIYGKLSGSSHHRRTWVEDNVIKSERRMIKGRTDVWIRRAATTDALLGVVEESVIIVADAFALFNETGWYEKQIVPLINAIRNLRVVTSLT